MRIDADCGNAKTPRLESRGDSEEGDFVMLPCGGLYGKAHIGA